MFDLAHEFPYPELEEATENFSTKFRLGQGAYGSVYKGVLTNGTEVAIKVLAAPGEAGFDDEVRVLSKFRHPNLVILMGWAKNGTSRLLVYEMLSGGDVANRLMKRGHEFLWEQRLLVALDAVTGLSHLHNCRPAVYHRDIKSANILMDRNGTAKMADFGLASVTPHDSSGSLLVEKAEGTPGYADPAYIQSLKVTEKTEVYAFGMVMLELLTSKPPAMVVATHPTMQLDYLIHHIDIRNVNTVMPLVDRRAQWPDGVPRKVGDLALRCICTEERSRPTSVEVVKELRSIVNNQGSGQGSGLNTQQAPMFAPHGQQPPQQQPVPQQAPQQQHGPPFMFPQNQMHHIQNQQQQQQQQPQQPPQQQQQQGPPPGSHQQQAAQPPHQPQQAPPQQSSDPRLMPPQNT
eukprot:Platyproteum_vivax@DN11021_c0_g1_i1.p1